MVTNINDLFDLTCSFIKLIEKLRLLCNKIV